MVFGRDARRLYGRLGPAGTGGGSRRDQRNLCMKSLRVVRTRDEARLGTSPDARAQSVTPDREVSAELWGNKCDAFAFSVRLNGC